MVGPYRWHGRQKDQSRGVSSAVMPDLVVGQPLSVGVDKAHQGNRVRHTRTRHTRDVVIGLLWPRPENPVFTQGLQALLLVVRNERWLHRLNAFSTGYA